MYYRSTRLRGQPGHFEVKSSACVSQNAHGHKRVWCGAKCPSETLGLVLGWNVETSSVFVFVLPLVEFGATSPLLMMMTRHI